MWPLTRAIAAPVTTLGILTSDPQHFPHALPDGRHFLFYAVPEPETRGVYVGQIPTERLRRRLSTPTPQPSIAIWPYLLFVRREHPARAAVRSRVGWTPSGDAVLRCRSDRRPHLPGRPSSHFSVGCRTNPLSQRPHDRRPPSSRSARRPGRKRPVKKFDERAALACSTHRCPRDGRQLAMFNGQPDLAAGPRDPATGSPFTLINENLNFAGVWSPDGRHFAFCLNCNGICDLLSEGRQRARAAKTCCWPLQRRRCQRIGRTTASTCSTEASARKTASTSGRMSMTDRKPVPVVEDRARRTRWPVLARWQMGGVPVQSERAATRSGLAVPLPGTTIKDDERFQFSTAGGPPCAGRATAARSSTRRSTAG